MNKLRLILSTTLALFLVCPGTARAGGLPVVDVTNLIESLRQLAQMELAYARQLQQLERAAEQVEAMSGHSGMGVLLNGPRYRNARRYTPRSWQDTLRILDAGGLPGSAADTRTIYKRVSKDYRIGSGANIDRRDDTSPNAIAHQRRRDTAYASMAVAERAFDEANTRTVNYEALMARIESTENAKAIADLATRVEVENGLSLNELVRLQTIRLQQQAAADQQGLVDATNMAAMLRYETHRLEDIPTE